LERSSIKNWQSVLICCALAAVTLAAFWPVSANGFINYDDQEYVYENTHVRDGLTWAGLRWAFTSTRASNWHPLTWLSHMLDAQLFGLHPAGHHLMSVAFHILNAILLFALLFRLTAKLWRSAFVGALFALHPLHVESVAWAAERKDVLSAFFGLLSLWAYVGYTGKVSRVKSQGSGKPNPESRIQNPATAVSRFKFHVSSFTHHAPRFCYFLSLLLFALSLMSKPMLVTLPFILLLLDFWPLGRLSWPFHAYNPTIQQSITPVFRLLLEKLPFFLLSLASSIVTVFVQQKAMIVYKALPFPYRAANTAVSYVRYLFKTIWPLDLAVLYPHPGSWPAGQVAVACIILALITVVALKLARTRPYLPVGWFWFLGALVPVIGLVQVGVQAMADRYTYLPLIGIFVIVAWTVGQWVGVSKSRFRLSAVAAGVLLAACAFRTHTQAGFWKDTETIFMHDLQVVPNSWVAHHNLALLALDRYQKTVRASVESQGLNVPTPSDSEKSRRDYLQEVIDRCQAALTAKPTLAEVHVTLAKALTEKGQLDEARAHLELAIHADPKNAQAKQTFAEILHRQGHAGEAAAAYRATLELEPDWGPVINNLAWLLATCPDASIRNGTEAVRLAQRVCNSTEGTNFWYLHTLAAAHAEAGDFSNAVATAEQAKKLTELTRNPDLIKKADSRLQLYKSHYPLRDP
jgi:tetratricopeptide (TPR) repeat protein